MPLFVVDSSTIISLAANCMLWVFEKLKGVGFEFVAPKSVEREVIDSGLDSMKFRYEAILVSRLFSEGIIEVHELEDHEQASQFLEWANTSFKIKNRFLKVLQRADAEVMCLAYEMKADGILCDERTLRLFIESPSDLERLFEHRFHSDVSVQSGNFQKIFDKMGNMPVFRSVEIVSLAVDMGFFNDIIEEFSKIHPDAKKMVIEGALESLRFAGCGISTEEINEYVTLLLVKKKQ